MPADGFDGDDGEKDETTRGKSYKEFDCPLCNANNPYDESFHDGDEIRCFYCGTEYKVKIDENGKLRLRET
jgi:transcription elongation factor Elf1